MIKSHCSGAAIDGETLSESPRDFPKTGRSLRRVATFSVMLLFSTHWRRSQRIFASPYSTGKRSFTVFIVGYAKLLSEVLISVAESNFFPRGGRGTTPQFSGFPRANGAPVGTRRIAAHDSYLSGVGVGRFVPKTHSSSS